MMYNQWVKFNISAKFCNIQVKHVVLKLGEFYEEENLDKEINKVEIDDVDNNRLITEIYWECPNYKRENSLIITEPPKDYIICEYGANLNKGPLGNISIKITKLE